MSAVASLETIPSPNPPAEVAGASKRLMSVDALRGFDMFWIIGADALLRAFQAMNKNPVTEFVATQLDHVRWEGFRFYDLIFPLFVFIMGVSLVFSLSKHRESEGKGAAGKRLLKRFVLMFVVAVLYSGGFSTPISEIRWLGVLNRIALCYFFGGLIFLFFKPRMIVAITSALLVGYWALLAFVPIRDIQMTAPPYNILPNNVKKIAEQKGMTNEVQLFRETTARVTGKFEPGLNVAHHFDYQYLPGRKYDKYWDPEGYLSTIPAIVTCLLGVFAGLLLKSGNFCDKWKLIYLFSFGVAGILLAYLWAAPFLGSLQFPVIKKLWTSSYVLLAGGWSAILLAAFYLIVDVWKKQAWCRPFVWMGMNSITIYLASNIIGGFRKLGQRFVGGDVKIFFDDHVTKGFGDLMLAIVGLTLAFWFVWFLYKKRIFLRL